MDTVNLPEDADTAGVPAGVELGMRPEHVGRELTQDEIDEADSLGKYAPDAGEGRADESGTEDAGDEPTTDGSTAEASGSPELM